MSDPRQEGQVFVLEPVAAYTNSQNKETPEKIAAHPVTINYSDETINEFRKLIAKTPLPGADYKNPYTGETESFPNSAEEFTARHLQIIARNQSINTSGEAGMNLYPGLTDDVVNRLHYLVTTTTVAGVIQVNKVGGYPEGSKAVTLDTPHTALLIDQAGIQFQGDLHNSGSAFFYPDDPKDAGLPNGYGQYQNDMFKVAYGKERPAYCSDQFIEVIWKGVKGRVDLNAETGYAFGIQVEYAKALKTGVNLAEQLPIEVGKDYNFRYLMAGLGNFNNGIIEKKQNKPVSETDKKNQAAMELARLHGIHNHLQWIKSLDNKNKMIELGKITGMDFPFSENKNNPEIMAMINKIEAAVKELGLKFNDAGVIDALKKTEGFINISTNTGDAFAMGGNEGQYASVDAMISVNSNSFHINAARNNNMTPVVEAVVTQINNTAPEQSVQRNADEAKSRELVARHEKDARSMADDARLLVGKIPDTLKGDENLNNAIRVLKSKEDQLLSAGKKYVESVESMFAIDKDLNVAQKDNKKLLSKLKSIVNKSDKVSIKDLKNKRDKAAKDIESAKKIMNDKNKDLMAEKEKNNIKKYKDALPESRISNLQGLLGDVENINAKVFSAMDSLRSAKNTGVSSQYLSATEKQAELANNSQLEMREKVQSIITATVKSLMDEIKQLPVMADTHVYEAILSQIDLLTKLNDQVLNQDENNTKKIEIDKNLNMLRDTISSANKSPSSNQEPAQAKPALASVQASLPPAPAAPVQIQTVSNIQESNARISLQEIKAYFDSAMNLAENIVNKGKAPDAFVDPLITGAEFAMSLEAKLNASQSLSKEDLQQFKQYQAELIKIQGDVNAYQASQSNVTTRETASTAQHISQESHTLTSGNHTYTETGKSRAQELAMTIIQDASTMANVVYAKEVDITALNRIISDVNNIQARMKDASILPEDENTLKALGRELQGIEKRIKEYEVQAATATVTQTQASTIPVQATSTQAQAGEQIVQAIQLDNMTPSQFASQLRLTIMRQLTNVSDDELAKLGEKYNECVRNISNIGNNIKLLILQGDTASTRANRIVFMHEVIREAIKNQDYTTAMTIVGVLGSSEVKQLYEAQTLIPKEEHEFIKSVTAFIGSGKNLANYMALNSDRNQVGAPSIPALSSIHNEYSEAFKKNTEIIMQTKMGDHPFTPVTDAAKKIKGLLKISYIEGLLQNQTTDEVVEKLKSEISVLLEEHRNQYSGTKDISNLNIDSIAGNLVKIVNAAQQTRNISLYLVQLKSNVEKQISQAPAVSATFSSAITSQVSEKLIADHASKNKAIELPKKDEANKIDAATIENNKVIAKLTINPEHKLLYFEDQLIKAEKMVQVARESKSDVKKQEDQLQQVRDIRYQVLKERVSQGQSVNKSPSRRVNRAVISMSKGIQNVLLDRRVLKETERELDVLALNVKSKAQTPEIKDVVIGSHAFTTDSHHLNVKELASSIAIHANKLVDMISSNKELRDALNSADRASLFKRFANNETIIKNIQGFEFNEKSTGNIGVSLGIKQWLISSATEVNMLANDVNKSQSDNLTKLKEIQHQLQVVEATLELQRKNIELKAKNADKIDHKLS